MYSKFREWRASFHCAPGFWGVLQVIDFGKNRFLCEISNAAKNCLNSALQLLWQAIGKFSMYLYG